MIRWLADACTRLSYDGSKEYANGRWGAGDRDKRKRIEIIVRLFTAVSGMEVFAGIMYGLVAVALYENQYAAELQAFQQRRKSPAREDESSHGLPAAASCDSWTTESVYDNLFDKPVA